MLLRADQFLARLGYCSRREATWWVKGGRVSQNGVVIEDPAKRIDPTASTVDGVAPDFPQRLLVAFNKPVGCVCSHESSEGSTIYDLLPERWMRRNPKPGSVGRLDKDTSGLIVITDDGALAHRWTSPKHAVEKVYLATLEQPLPDGMVELFASGTLMLHNESEPCRPARLEILGECEARVIVTEGRYHQVRRMFASQGCGVVSLHRERIGRLELGDLPPGQWREIAESAI